jgi:phosphoribosyl 1,2-cyclic phosphodiesterase
VDGFILLDAGETQYLAYQPKHVFITHFHSDHAAIGLQDVPRETKIYAPEASTKLPMIRIVSKPVRLGAYTVTPIPTVHSQHVKSSGYLVESKDGRFLYTSDLIRIKPRFHSLLKGLDLVITDGSFVRTNGLIRKDRITGRPSGHNGIPNLVRFFSQFTDRIVITHFGTWFFKNIAQSRRKIESLGNGVRVLPAHDGMHLSIKHSL